VAASAAYLCTASAVRAACRRSGGYTEARASQNGKTMVSTNRASPFAKVAMPRPGAVA
jgi:hypothetical protein